MTITKTSSGNYSMVLSNEEAALMDRVEAEFGKTVLQDLIQNWLSDRQRLFDDQDAKDFKTKFQALKPKDQKAILDTLNTVVLP